MKQSAIRFLACLGILFLTNCASEQEPYTPIGNDGYLQLVLSQPDTRADLSSDGSGTFREGDRVGLYIDNGNEIQYRELTYTAGEWQPRLKRSTFGEGRLRLSAHYPVQVTSGASDPESHSFRIELDQSSFEENPSDLLVSQDWLETGDYQAQLIFRHAMHRLRISCEGSTEEIAVTVRSQVNGTVNLLTGETSLLPGDYQWIVPTQNSDGSYLAIIYPQSVSPYRTEEGLLRFNKEGTEVYYKIPEDFSDGEELSNFEAGKQTAINLSIQASNPDLANRTMWVYGVNAPDFPGKENIPSYASYVEDFPPGEWFRYNWTFNESQNLPWKEGCGWYDCNKSEKYTENDANLCWAASASNLLIWWMVHNKSYIEAYDREYGSSVTTSLGRSVERPAPDFKPLYANDGSVNRAPVFEFFKHNFLDRANWNSAAVNWFLTGNVTNLQSVGIQGFPGFFTEVFQSSDIIATDSPRHPSKEQFNAFVLDALLHKQALGFTVVDIAGEGTGMHAMVIWGVEFDEMGVISHIYYCDNNNADQDPNGAVIKRYKVVYATDESTSTGGVVRTYIQPLDNEEGIVKKKFRVAVLCSVDLRRDIWQQKYPEIQPE